MRVNLYSYWGPNHETPTVFDGDEDLVLDHMKQVHPWLEGSDTVAEAVDRINMQQAMHAEVEEDEAPDTESPNFAGFSGHHHPAFEAARFLSREAAPVASIRSSLWYHENPIDAALHAYGLDVSDDNRRALGSIQQMQELSKAQPEWSLAPTPESIVPVFDSGTEYAKLLKKGYEEARVRPLDSTRGSIVLATSSW